MPTCSPRPVQPMMRPMRYVAIILLLAACSSTTTTVIAATTSSPSATPTPTEDACDVRADYAKLLQQLVDRQTMTRDELIAALTDVQDRFDAQAAQWADDPIVPMIRTMNRDIGALKVRIDNGDGFAYIAMTWAGSAVKNIKAFDQAVANGGTTVYCYR